MDDEEMLACMLKEIRELIEKYTSNKKIETNFKLEKNNRVLSIVIEGVSDMEIYFENIISEEKES
ncbi:hypothetical protein [Erwinia psidii]|uniref:hypothetical protein n=1 Tax=Erwinia psidii TaxID=69224 RepID=UPI0013157BDB|nr:hypothetical protein [Erwinia psidii]MCX8960870.1 hypothetical protein [Erwinia psidii]MCX8964890.1 hypothetical protein [Erwinia psidii]